MKKIGLTGGIGTGKTTVSDIIKKQGFQVIDADEVSRTVVEPGTYTLESIKLAFGDDVIENGELDRKKLGKIVFSDKAQLEKLNEIIQPAISKQIDTLVSFAEMSDEKAIIISAPLLFERDYRNRVDEVWVVYSAPQQQLDRVIKRDKSSLEEAQAKISAQMPIDEKRALADKVIENTDDISLLENQVQRLIDELKSEIV